MSLKSFHIVFVFISSLLMIYLMNWSLYMSNDKNSDYFLYSIIAGVGLVSLIIYSFKFLNFYNKGFEGKKSYNFSNILSYIFYFVLPPLGIIKYLKLTNKESKDSKNILVSILSGTIIYLVIIFGYISYFIEKDSLNEYKQKLEDKHKTHDIH